MKNNIEIKFEGKVTEPAATAHDTSWFIALPEAASKKLPSRGLVSVKGKINNKDFATTLEPDGNMGHLLRLSHQILDETQLKIGDNAIITLKPVEEEPEPKIPSDLAKAIKEHPEIQKVWKDITPAARREWVFWVTTAKQAKTRARRVEVSISKMKGGHRRPCCYDNRCAIVSFEPFKDKK